MTGVQTCALPISVFRFLLASELGFDRFFFDHHGGEASRTRAPDGPARRVSGLLGGAFVLSAAIDQYEIEPLLNSYFFRQLVFYGVGLGLAAVFVVVDYHRLAGWARAAYWLTLIFLVLVLIPGIGEVRYGARRWLDLGITLIQPSEFAKLAFIFALADFLTRPNEEMLMPGVFLKALGMTALPFILILKEPDLGSSLVFFPIGIAMMFVRSEEPRVGKECSSRWSP